MMVLQFVTTKAETSNLGKCFLATGASISSLAASVRRLVLDGQELSSRHLLRCLREYVDLQCLLQMRPELCDEFITTIDEATANTFWHRHLSKRKFKKALSDTGLKREIFESYWSWRDQEDGLLAMSSHPSYGASIELVLLAKLYDTRDELYSWSGFLGHRSTDSISTLRYAWHTLDHYAAIAVVPAIIPAIRDDKVIFEFYQHATAGKRVLAELRGFVYSYLDSNELEFQNQSIGA